MKNFNNLNSDSIATPRLAESGSQRLSDLLSQGVSDSPTRRVGELPTLRLSEFSFKRVGESSTPRLAEWESRRLTEPESRQLAELPSRGVVFRLGISPRIGSQKQNSSKGSIRGLWGTNFCKNPRKSASLPCTFKSRTAHEVDTKVHQERTFVKQ